MKRAQRSAMVVAVLASVSSESGCRRNAPRSGAHAAVVAPPSDQRPPRSYPELMCIQAIVVSWTGADNASDVVTRSEEEARTRAEAALAALEQGNISFERAIEAYSDDGRSRTRGGLFAAFPADTWPEQHRALEPAMSRLGVGQRSEVLRARYGYVIARRCVAPTRGVRAVIVRFQDPRAGSTGTSSSVVRSRDEARTIVNRIYDTVRRTPHEMAALARRHSEDADSARYGGDLGRITLDELPLAVERIAFSIAPSVIAPPIETDGAFWLVMRTE